MSELNRLLLKSLVILISVVLLFLNLKYRFSKLSLSLLSKNELKKL